jgi:hypothetical protein
VIGTFINIAAVLIGGTLGLVFGSRLSLRIRQTIIAGLGLFTAAIGIQMFLKTQNPIIVLVSLLFGGVVGELAKIEDLLSNVGDYFERKYYGHKQDDDPNNPESNQSSSFVKGFLTASLVFCVGPMTILGSLQDGLTGDYSLLAIKSVLDGFAALAFASTLGVGVLFSVVVILVYQGGITLLAEQAQAVFNEAMIAEMTAVGGIILIGIAVSSLLEMKKIRVGNFLPALFIAPLIVLILAYF